MRSIRIGDIFDAKAESSTAGNQSHRHCEVDVHTAMESASPQGKFCHQDRDLDATRSFLGSLGIMSIVAFVFLICTCSCPLQS